MDNNMEIKDLKVGDKILLYYYNGEFVPYKIVKVLEGSVFYKKNGDLYRLDSTDAWVLDTPSTQDILTEHDWYSIKKWLVILGVWVGFALVGALLSTI